MAPADTEGHGRHEGQPPTALRLRGLDPALSRSHPPAELRHRGQTGAPYAPCPEADALNSPIPVADPRSADRWGPYAAAITRWEALTRPAPDPVDAHSRLQPRFVEWMQGLPHGWVTDTPDLSRPAQLTALGNGVVPQQAIEALQQLKPLITCQHA